MANILIIFGAKYLHWLSIIIALIYLLKQPKARRKEIFVFAVIALPTAYAAAKIAGLFYYNPRPFVAENFLPLIPHAPDNGFPSDHALLGGSIAAILFPYSPILSGLAWFITSLVGLSRVFAGIHHPVDIFGSWTIAIAIVFLVKRFVMPGVLKLKVFNRFANG